MSAAVSLFLGVLVSSVAKMMCQVGSVLVEGKNVETVGKEANVIGCRRVAATPFFYVRRWICRERTAAPGNREQNVTSQHARELLHSMFTCLNQILMEALGLIVICQCQKRNVSNVLVCAPRGNQKK